MSAKSRAERTARKAGSAAGTVRSNPYVQRLVHDDQLRTDLRTAYESARHAYGRMNNGKGPARALLDDKKVQKDINQALDSLRDASQRMREKPKRRHFGRMLVIGIVGAGAVLVASEGARKKVLDALFGAEEEFEYTSTTAPPAPAPTGAASNSS